MLCARFFSISLGLGLFLATGTAWTQEPQKEPAKTVKTYEFRDDTIVGQRSAPGAFVVQSTVRSGQKTLILVRKTFVPEMIRSVEDL